MQPVWGHAQNPGLAWARYAKTEELRKEDRQRFLKRVADKVKWGDRYLRALQSYGEALAALGYETREYVARSPLAIGLGGPSQFEVALTFSKPYGMPVIPGSSIKGAIRREAARMLGVNLGDLANATYAPNITAKKLAEGLGSESLDPGVQAWLEVFGSPEAAAAFEVADAWLVPEARPFLMLDTITVHHPLYYRGTQGAPRDTDDPVPNSFICVRPGQKFLFAIRGDQGAELFKILDRVLTKKGIGAKTNAGYGRFKRSQS